MHKILLHLIFSDLDKFDFYKFSEHYDDYKYAMELTSEILFLEVIYRILVCIFEVKLFIICVSIENFRDINVFNVLFLKKLNSFRTWLTRHQ